MKKITLAILALTLSLGFSANTYADPFIASLVCEPAGGSGGVYCDAYPFDEATYNWHVTFHGTFLSGCTDNNFSCGAVCTGFTNGNATLTMTIGDGNGFASSASRTFACDNTGGGGAF